MKKTSAATLILVCLLALGAVCSGIVKAQSSDDFTINADGNVTPSTAPIQQTGSTYTLTSNVYGSIAVNRSNSILDGNGYTLFGKGYTAYGDLSLNEVSNVTVKNFTIVFIEDASASVGIQLIDSSKVVVANNTVTGFESIQAMNGFLFAGIDVEGGTSDVIAENNITYNLDGITFFGTSHNQVVGNNIVGDWSSCGLYSTGIYFGEASNNTIYHNNILNSTTQAEVSGSVNIWDDGYPNGGNFWGDYWTKYPNADGRSTSGIANLPYVIDPKNMDRYPLVKPFNSTLYAIETVSPKISVLSPIDKKYNASVVPLVFAVDKAVTWMGYSLDGKQNVTITGNTNIANMTNGLHTLVIYANDTFGDIGASQTVNFTVSKPEPFPTAIIAAVSGAVGAVALSAGLLVYVKKPKHKN